MKKADEKLSLDRPATYQIKVQGRLDESWSEWFEGMTITVESGDEGPTITTLTGVVADQAALQGLLDGLYSLGLSLCSVKLVGADLAQDGRNPDENGLTATNR
jgi:hypothetical protein